MDICNLTELTIRSKSRWRYCSLAFTSIVAFSGLCESLHSHSPGNSAFIGHACISGSLLLLHACAIARALQLYRSVIDSGLVFYTLLGFHPQPSLFVPYNFPRSPMVSVWQVLGNFWRLGPGVLLGCQLGSSVHLEFGFAVSDLGRKGTYPPLAL